MIRRHVELTGRLAAEVTTDERFEIVAGDAAQPARACASPGPTATPGPTP